MREAPLAENGRRGSSPEALLRRKLFRLLRWAEQQEQSGIATVTDAGRPRGELLLSRGRLCLAIPARPCPQDAGALDPSLLDLVQRSRLTGTFSAVAAAAGRDALERARAGLLQLLVRNLACLLGPAADESLHAELRPALDDYERRLTFSPSEVLAACLARTLGPLDALAAELVETLECSTLLVLARGEEEHEVPYPIACRGLEALTVTDLFKMVRTASDLCPRAAGAAAGAGDFEVVSLSEGALCWHFVGGPRRVVAVSAARAHAEESLSRAIVVAIGR
jgi:hypothetical protein